MQRSPHAAGRWTATTALVLSAGLTGCQPATPKPAANPFLPGPTTTVAATRPTSAPPTTAIFSSPGLGVSVGYPADWAARPEGERAQRWFSPDGRSTFGFDVPVLPFYALVVPLERVRQGYIDDARQKRMSDATVTDLTPPAFPDAAVSRIVMFGHDKNGTDGREEAVLIVRANKVYVISGGGDAAGYPAAHAAVDAAVASLRWTK